MALSNRRSKLKTTGGRYIPDRKKRKREVRNLATLTKIGEKAKRVVRTLGGNKKEFLLKTQTVNVYNPKTKKYKVVNLKAIVENKANRHFVRRNILTKGAVVETDAGKARITSRPGQEATVNAVLIE